MISGALLFFVWTALSTINPLTPQANSTQKTLRGYLLLAHEFVAPSQATSLNRLRFNGKARLELMDGRLSLNYSSRHWMTFRHVEQSMLAEPFKNRHVLQSLTLDGRDLLVRGFSWRLGRLFPNILYAASPLLDGAELNFSRSGWHVTLAAGKAVDIWDGAEFIGDVHLSGGVTFTTNRIQSGLSFYQGHLGSQNLKELGGGLSLKLGRGFFLDGQGAWDIDSGRLARASGALVRRDGALNISVMASLWRTPAGRYMGRTDDDGIPALPTLGSEDYRDLRLNLGWHRGDFALSISGGILGGVRQGSLASLSVQPSRIWGIRPRFIAHYLDSSHMRFYALEVRILGALGSVGVEVQSQYRLYQWKARPEGWWNSDNQTLVQLDIPLVRQVVLLLEGGMVFRDTARDRTYPFSSIRLLWRF